MLTAIFAYLQIALGGVVRVSGSGLGCPDWPLCHGRPYPPADIHAIVEYSHRAVGTLTVVLIIATVILAWVVYRQRRPVVAWLASASLIGVVVEAALGGIVVRNDLASWLVLAHLGVAMVLLGFLVATAIMAMPSSAGVPDRAFRRVAVIAAAATYVTLLTGSTVVASGADESCRTWPLCGSGFSLDFSGASAFTMLHRGGVLVFGAFLVYVLLAARSRPGLGRVALATIAVLALQIAVGAGAAITDGAFFNGLHVAIATLIWAGALSIVVLTFPRADREQSLSRLAVENRPA